MFLIKGGQSESGERHHVFVELPPDEPPPACQVVADVSLTAHPPSDDPNAPTLRVVLYRDPTAPNSYHYLLPPTRAKHLKRAGGSPFVYRTWDEFARLHPSVVAEMSG